MKTGIKIISVMLISAITSVEAISQQKSLNIIPKPAKAVIEKGEFRLTKRSVIVTSSDDPEFNNIVRPIQEYLQNICNKSPLTLKRSGKPSRGSIFLKLNSESGIQKEGYKLSVMKKGVVIEASDFAGLFYGVQSLLQMIPVGDYGESAIKITCATIEDSPRFGWRGLHLDVCRHFMPKEFVLKYIDYMSMYKFNTFHFHLTDDQGWRIEMEKYPDLVNIGSVRSETRIGKSDKFDGTEHRGYFTKEEIREIVKYAAERYITVVPEIEMPGHASAALTSYPELGCTGGPYKVQTKWGVFDEVFCAGKESTFKFLQDVIDEVIELFPSKFIHIGGDECPKSSWKSCPLCQQRIKDEGLSDEHQLQSWFVTRMEKYINEKGRKIIGWDEILEGGLAPNAAVMSWRGVAGGIEAAKAGHYVVMSPGTHCYFDHYQADAASQPLAIGGFTPLEKVYGYEPVPEELTSEESKYIMGAQANVWTEYILSPEHVEYMVYPRAAALSEVVWTPNEGREYSDFKRRVTTHTELYKKIGINYCKSEFEK